MCMFMHLYMYIYIYIDIFMCMSTFMLVYVHMFIYVFHRPSGSGRLHLLPFSFIPYERFLVVSEGSLTFQRGLSCFPFGSLSHCLVSFFSLVLALMYQPWPFWRFLGFACFLFPCPPFLFCRLTFTASSLFFLGS